MSAATVLRYAIVQKEDVLVVTKVPPPFWLHSRPSRRVLVSVSAAQRNMDRPVCMYVKYTYSTLHIYIYTCTLRKTTYIQTCLILP